MPVAALAAALALQARAQVFSGPITAGIKTLQENNLLPMPEQVSPTQPSGNPLPPARRASDLPPAGDFDQENGYFNLINHGGSFEQKNGQLHVDGGIEFTDRGYHCWADEAFGDRNTNVFTLKGNVRVEGRDESITGDTVVVDFTNKTFIAENAESILRPGLTKGLIDNLYVKGANSHGGEAEVWGENTSSTTCSYASPHFEIESESTDVRPGTRVIFRKAKIIILGHVVLKLPYLSIPLDERTYNNLPVVGKDSIAGYFIKNRYAFPISHSADFISRFDYYTKLGLGLGGGVKSDNPTTHSAFSVYTIQGPQPELELLAHHQQNFKWGTLTFDNSYEDDNYLISSQSKILNTRANIYVPQRTKYGMSSDRFSFFRTDSNSTGSDSHQQSIVVDDTRFWSKKVNTTFDFRLSQSSSTFTGGQPIHREEADVNFRIVDDLEKAKAQLDYIRSIPIGMTTTTFFTSSDVTPALTLLSDAAKLYGQKFAQKFPFQIQLGYGEYGDPITKGRLTRSDLDFNFHNVPKNPAHWSLDYQGEFKQDLYSDNTAQYILSENTQINYNFHSNSHFHISYNYLRPYGYTPLQIDRRGESNDIIADLSYSPIKHLMVGLATGYDFDLIKEHQPTPWQQAGLQATYTLGKTFSFRALSTYDTTLKTLSSTRFDLTWSTKPTFLSLGAKYDGERHKWAAANMYLDGFQIGRLRTSLLLNYDGYTKQFDAMHYSFIYDLHCAEAVLQVIDNPTGFNGGRSIYFFIRLKALPFDTPFGTGTHGQPIGTATGRD